MNDGEMVLFMVDENFKYLTPRRIHYHPGVTLDVLPASGQEVQESPGIVDSALVPTSNLFNTTGRHMYNCPHGTNDTALLSVKASIESMTASIAGSLSTTTTAVEYTHGHGYDTNNDSSVLQQLCEMSMATVKTIETSSGTCSPELVQEARRFLQKSFQTIDQLSTGPQSQSSALYKFDKTPTNTDANYNRRIGLRSVISENDLFQIRNSQMLRTMLENQQQLLNHIQSVARQTYELIEYSIPRLFIVLPKPSRKRDKLLRPFTKQFKLFFLCECGSSVQHGNHQYPQRIHLAKHEGYDLDQVDDFFVKYGPYVLTILKMLKIGLAVTGVALPALACFKLVDGIETLERCLGAVSRNASSLLDHAINAVRSMTEDHTELLKTIQTSERMDLTGLGALEGADLRQLESFLRMHDQNRVFGNLNRIIATDGHVKWVCTDHFLENYKMKEMRHFRELVDAYGGWFLPSTRTVTINLMSDSVAKAFYDAMARTYGIRKLHVVFLWDVAQYDLQMLADAVTKACVRHLHIRIPTFKRHAPGTIMHDNQFNPLVQLLCNGNLRGMHLENFRDFFSRVDSGSIIAIPSRLKELRISSTFSPCKRSHVSALVSILKYCPTLVYLRLSTDCPRSTLDLLTSQPSLIPSLGGLGLVGPEATVRLTLSQGTIRNVRLALSSDGIILDRGRLLQLDHLTYLDMGQPTVETIKAHLGNIMGNNPSLSNIKVKILPEHSTTIVKLFTETRDMHIHKGTAVTTRQDVLNVMIGWHHANVMLALLFSGDSSTPSISTSVAMVSSAVPRMAEHYLELFHEFGWSIRTLEAMSGFTDKLAFALDASTRERGSTIMDLELNPRLLSFAGLGSMDRIIERSQDLARLKFCFRNLEVQTKVQKAKYLLDRYHENIHSLSFSGTSAHIWLLAMGDLCKTRSEFPDLEAFAVYCGSCEIPRRQVEWIASMISTPCLQTTDSFQDELFSGDCLTELEPDAKETDCFVSDSWPSLRRVTLSGLQLVHEDWKTVIGALDLSGLRALALDRTNFSTLEFELLLSCILAQANPVEELLVDVRETDFSQRSRTDKVHEQTAILQEKAPWVHVTY
ncbi:hypothetical protein BGX31_000330 [Mortierella sp. GBA43]|nr:hypothetical protein BGX31_000330 [Mortierella sp. GBA43]